MPLVPHVKDGLNPNDINRLLSIFKKLGWTINPKIEEMEDYENKFKNFCDLISLLNKEEKDLVLNLTEDFLHCPLWNYPTLLKTAFTDVPSEFLDKSSAVFLTRLLSPKDKGKSKSSSQMPYMARHQVVPNLVNFAKKTLHNYDEPDLIAEKHKGRKNSLIILLDDFIGSGDTAIEAISYFNDNIRNDSDTLILISLVAQLQGVLKIEDLGYKIFYAHLRARAITDSDTISNKFKALKIIRKIEKRMGIKKQTDPTKDYRLGYRHTQALVSMIRSPNNTLPIYWWSTKPNGKKWNGIFRR